MIYQWEFMFHDEDKEIEVEATDLAEAQREALKRFAMGFENTFGPDWRKDIVNVDLWNQFEALIMTQRPRIFTYIFSVVTVEEENNNEQ